MVAPTPTPVHESVYRPTETFIHLVSETEFAVTGTEMFPFGDTSVHEDTFEAVIVSPHLPDAFATISGAKVKVATGSTAGGVHPRGPVTLHPVSVQV